MNNQFSYELDERQIKNLMQDAELEYNEALWNKFDSLQPSNDCKSSSLQIGNYIPKFNFSFSRSIILPVLFIILIGSLSAVLFSFVDFKKKENIDKEIPLVANPANFKKSEATAAKIIKHTEVKVNPVKTLIASTPSINTIPIVTKAMPASKTKQAESVKIVESAPKEKIQSITEVKKETTPVVVKKKKKKLQAEELPTIKAVTNLTEVVNEPELELDLK